MLPSAAVEASNAARNAIQAVFRAEHGRVFAALVRALGDFHAAEDALDEAVAVAVETWPARGIPDKPAAWLTTVARNAATSARRHAALVRDKHAELAREADVAAGSLDEDDVPDERLRLIFTCCHPALSEEARVALTLHTLSGLSTVAIARLFFVPEATVAQRLVRAKKKIRAAGIPFEVPSAERLDERLDTVLSVVYLMFTEGYASAAGEEVICAELCEEAIRLGKLLCTLAPSHAEARGLHALMVLHHARRVTRVDESGDIVPLDEQDRGRWDRRAIGEGQRQLDEALARGAPGPYQIQAAIAALHATSERPEVTDWHEIAGLYAELHRRQPSPTVALALAFAEGMALGPEHGLARLDAIEASGVVDTSERGPAARADLLRRAGRVDEAAVAYTEAIRRSKSPRVRRYLERRLAECARR